MGYDPTGEINWRGFIAGAAIAALGALVVAAAVVTGGTSIAVTGALITAAKITTAAVGSAITATGVTTAYGAATEKPIVFDVSYVNGDTRDKHGCSTVVDFASDSVGIDTYYHYGKTTSGYAVSYGTGFVDGYEKPGDYGGYFADATGTYTLNGVDFGFDICTDPSISFGKCSAGLFTVGFSGTPCGKISGSIGYDYYLPISYTEIRWD